MPARSRLLKGPEQATEPRASSISKPACRSLRVIESSVKRWTCGEPESVDGGPASIASRPR